MDKTPEKSSNDLRELVYRGVESDELDYKAALNWTGMSRAARAKIVRHCIALANTKGGYIVVGVGEDASGQPSVYQGLTPEQAHGFDPSTAGPFINRYVEPPIDFTIERPVIDGKRYAIFVVRPFKKLPHVCTASIENELQTGVFYIRTTDASSRPAYRAIEMQALIQRSLRNQREELGRMLRGILYENRSGLQESAATQFADTIASAQVFFRRRKSPPPGMPSLLLNLSVEPPNYNPEAFTLSHIRRAVDNAWTLLAGSEFIRFGDLSKAYLTNVSLRSLPEKQLKMWQVFKTGLFHYIEYLEAPDRRVSYENLVKALAEAVSFLGKLYAELGYAEELLTIRLTISGTENFSLRPNADSDEEFRCRIPEVRIEMRRSAADLATGFETHAQRLIRECCERFNLPEHYLQNLPRLIHAHLERR